jgi:hypothetical protein
MRRGPLFRGAAYAIMILIFINGYVGTKLHEETSLYRLDSHSTSKALVYFKSNRKSIEKAGIISFVDNKKETMCAGWGGCAKKLENTFHGSFFLDYYFPGENIKVEYGEKGEGHTIDSSLFIK